MNKEQDKENIEEIKKVIVENIEIALEDICSIKKFTELEEDNIKTILEWLIRIQLEEVEKEIDKLKEAIETDRFVEIFYQSKLFLQNYQSRPNN